VQVAAILPPGISHVVEGFMQAFARQQLDETVRVIAKKN